VSRESKIEGRIMGLKERERLGEREREREKVSVKFSFCGE
jgi:hypothetical protein